MQLCERGLFCVKNVGVWSPMLLHNLLLCAEGSFYVTVRWTSQNETHGIMPRPMCFVPISFSVKTNADDLLQPPKPSTHLMTTMKMKKGLEVTATMTSMAHLRPSQLHLRPESQHQRQLQHHLCQMMVMMTAAQSRHHPRESSEASLMTTMMRFLTSMEQMRTIQMPLLNPSPKLLPQSELRLVVVVGFFQLDNCPASCFVNLCQTVM